MRKRGAALAALAVAVLLAAPAWAQSPHLAGAQREGKVVWYTVVASSTAQRVAKLFEAAHPGVKVEVHRSGSERVFQRLMQEAGAGIKNADVMDTADIGHVVVLKRKAMLTRYAPAGSERFPETFRDRDGMAYPWRAFPVVIPYNPKLLSPAEAPRSWKDLLDPRWRGKLVTAHPGYAGSVLTQVYVLSKLYGWEFFRDLAQQKPMLVQSVHDPVQVVTAGERAVGVNAAEYFVYAQRKKGNAIAAVYPQDGVPLILVPTAILAAAPHPSAARLFTDFVFSKPVQQILVTDEGLYVPHPEVTYPPDKPKLSELKVLPFDPEDLERQNEEIKKRFVELFGA